ncbi:MAG TPA: YbaN family protein [Kofleriaceae bacterium]|jgi:uncharacterized membrane protein YbaN (DUF454 family)|nr:YbaN family protein [Kofleriaceae bacterium]
MTAPAPAAPPRREDDAPPPVAALPVARSRTARVVWAIVGWGFFALGIIGAMLPVMPTTVFMLLAAWAFSRSSKRLEAWLLAHRRFGPPLVRWRQHRVIPLSAKLLAWGSMAVSLAVLILVSHASWPVIAAAAAVMLASATFIALCPSRPPRPPRPARMD